MILAHRVTSLTMTLDAPSRSGGMVCVLNSPEDYNINFMFTIFILPWEITLCTHTLYLPHHTTQPVNERKRAPLSDEKTGD